MKLTAAINQNDLDKVKSMLSGCKNGAPTAVFRAVKKTIRSTIPEAARKCGKPNRQMNMPAKEIKPDFRGQDPGFSFPSGYIECKSKRRPNVAFFSGTKPKINGVSAKTMMNKPRYLIHQAFFARGQNAKEDSRKLVFRRLYVEKPGYVAKKKRHDQFYEKEKRNPIRGAVGPAVIDIFNKPAIFGPVAEFGADLALKNLDYEASEILRRYQAGLI